MPEVTDAMAHLAKDVRFCFPLVGAILTGLVLLTFKDLGTYQQLAPILVVYTLGATLFSWAQATGVYLADDCWKARNAPGDAAQIAQRHWMCAKSWISIVAFLLQCAWIGFVGYIMRRHGIL